MRGVAIAWTVMTALASAWAGPVPDWRLPDFPRRAVFRPPPSTGTVVVIRVPMGGCKPGGSFAAQSAAGAPLACRILSENAAEATLAVAIAPGAPGATHVVYYGAPANSADSTADRTLRASRPVLVETCRTSGKGVPNSWERFLYLQRTARAPFNLSLDDRFRSVNIPDGESGRRGGRDRYVIVREQSFLLCPATAVYRFALDCRNAGFVLLDGEPALEYPGEHPAGTWRLGPAMLLNAGVHRIEVFSFQDRRGHLQLGWRRDTADAVEPIPDSFLIAPQEAVDRRIERIDRTVHPSFVSKLQTAYTFHGFLPVFVPVRFKNTSTDWLADDMVSYWRFDGGKARQDKDPVHVFEGLAEHRASLEVRDAMGFAGKCVQRVDCRALEPVRYALAVNVADLAAVCYADDKIEPTLRLTGEVPAEYAFSVQWATYQRGEMTKQVKDAIKLNNQTVSIPLVSARAGSIDRIEWQLQHAGIAVATGVVKFLKPPFQSLPDRVEGDRLYDKQGVQLVLVPSTGDAAQQPVIATAQAFGRILCADDCLASPGVRAAEVQSDFCRFLDRFVDGPERPIVKHFPLPSWEETGSGHGPLLKLVQVPQALDAGTDVVILSVGRQDIFWHEDVAAFERNMAALSDIISTTMKKPVVWVTPPPYPSDPGIVRPYAAAIRRVAAARSMPVADVFTGFLGCENPAEMFLRDADPVLTQSAQELAGWLIARALLAE